jgi:hypothetical protein
MGGQRVSRSPRYTVRRNKANYGFSSNSAVDYFISGVLESAGVKDEIKKMNINLGKSCMQLAFVSQFVEELYV